MADNRRERDEERRRERERQSAADRLKDTWEAISSEIFGVSGAGFWEQVRMSKEDMREIEEKTKNIREDLSMAELDFADALSKKLSTIQDTIKSNKIEMSVSAESFESLSDQAKIDFRDMVQKEGFLKKSAFQPAIKNLDTLSEKYQAIKALSEGSVESLSKLPPNIRKSVAESMGLYDIYEKINKEQGRLNNHIDNSNKKRKYSLDLVEGLYEMSDNLRKTAIKNAFAWDATANAIQRQSGIMLSSLDDVDGEINVISKTAGRFTSEMAKYGMSIEDIGKFVGEIGEEMRSTNTNALRFAESWNAISKATGISTKEVAEIGGNLVKMGQSAESTVEFFEQTNKESRALGVNARRVFESINRNLVKMQSFGFSEGEESLSRMALRAEQLRINVDEIFDVAERARTIEGAMDMAAQLQLAAGSFSNINPMELLSAARQGPDELGKILAQMGSDIGSFNEKGEFKVDPIDGDRLRIVAEATGMQYETLFEMIRRNAMDTKKVSGVFSDSFFARAADGIDEFDAAMLKSSFSDLLEIGEKGEIKLTTDGAKLLDSQGITNWKTMTDEQMQNLMKARLANAKTLKEQAEENMSLKDSITSLVNSITNTLSVFEPLIEGVTWVVTSLNESLGAMGKIISLGIISSFSILGPLLAQKISIGILSKLGIGIGPALKSLGSGVSAIGQAQINIGGIARFAGALALIGGAVVAFSYSMDRWGGEASADQMATAAVSLGLLAGGLVIMSQTAKAIDRKGIGIATGAMLAAAVGVGAFGFAAQQMSDVKWDAVLQGLTAMGLTIAGMTGIGALLAATSGGAFGILLAGLGAMVTAAGGIVAVAYILNSASDQLNNLANINWSGFGNMGSALLKAAPGIAAFGLASMTFASPLTIVGLWAMSKGLGSVAEVLIPMVQSLETGASSMERFAAAITELKSAVKELDVGKLEDIKEISNSMASAASSNALANIYQALQKMQSTFGGGKNSPRELKIRLFLPNGRELKSMILEDTATQSGR